ncbi:MAG TPA: OsmC family protein [Ktedonobacterales bacterium]|jgi:putative redox protein|nr:OsmC family protein [Ktedonobacterales bacterium]
MGEIMTANARLVAGMEFAAEAGSGHHLTLDAAEHGGGNDRGFRPMELLLVGLAGCTAMDVIGILRKKRQHVTSYETHVTGERADDHPMVYTDVTVEHIITGHGVDPEAVARAIELSETKYCGAGATISKTAKLKHTFRVIEAEPEAVEV